MGRVNHSKCNKNKQYKKRHDTKRRGKDVDQIQEEIKQSGEGVSVKFDPDEDLPGLGQYYCMQCARHFVDSVALGKHTASKIHKRRLKDLAEEMYTQDEADWAAGKTKESLGYVGKRDPFEV